MSPSSPGSRSLDHPLKSLFEPSSVVIIGSSKDPRKRGFQAVRALVEGGYQGGIFPVNPSGGELLGLPVSRSLDDIEAVPDLALICTPAGSVPEVLETCARKGVRGAVVLAVGFRESGGDGVALERQVLEVARRTGIRVVGPNTSGVLNTALHLNLVGIRNVHPGPLALVAQSGNVGLAVMHEAASRSYGVSIYVGVGNETDLAFHEYLDYLGAEPQTGAILMYVEGFQDGQRFIEVARRVSPDKPIVLLKGGRSESGVAAARSHTGAIAGSAAVLRAALTQAGVHLVERSDELLPVGEVLAGQPPVRAGSGVVVLSDGGGYATLAADSLSERGVELAVLASETRDRLRTLLGPAAHVNNPVDVAGAGDRDPEVFARVLEALVADPATGGVLKAGLFGGYALRFSEDLAAVESETAKALAEIVGRAGVPLVVQSLYSTARTEALERLGESGVPVVRSLEVAAACMMAAQRRGRFLVEVAQKTAAELPPPRIAEPLGLVKATEDRRTTLLETEVRDLVAGYGVSAAPATFCATPDEVRAASGQAPGPVAVKVVSASIIHKTDAGGVALDVPSADEAVAAYGRVIESASRYAEARSLPPEIEGVLVSPMLPPPVAELIVGARRDPQCGPVLTVGPGGLAVELFRDSAVRALPISREEAILMLGEFRFAPILDGYRGRPAASKTALADVLLGIAACFLSNPELSALEANPVFAYPDRAIAVDLRGLLHNIRSPKKKAGKEAVTALRKDPHPGL